MIKATSRVKLNLGRIKELNQAAVTALEQTAEALHTEVVQAQVMPRDEGTLQNESTFVDYIDSKTGKATLVSTVPYARRLYYHPEYKFDKEENENAKGKWYEDWVKGGKKDDFAPNAFKELYRRISRL